MEVKLEGENVKVTETVEKVLNLRDLAWEIVRLENRKKLLNDEISIIDAKITKLTIHADNDLVEIVRNGEPENEPESVYE